MKSASHVMLCNRTSDGLGEEERTGDGEGRKEMGESEGGREGWEKEVQKGDTGKGDREERV